MPAMIKSGPNTNRNQRDWMDHDGACELANRIQAYWKGQGTPVTVWVERQRVDMRGVLPNGENELYVVRSDLKGGMPQMGANNG